MQTHTHTHTHKHTHSGHSNPYTCTYPLLTTSPDQVDREIETQKGVETKISYRIQNLQIYLLKNNIQMSYCCHYFTQYSTKRKIKPKREHHESSMITTNINEKQQLSTGFNQPTTIQCGMAHLFPYSLNLTRLI
jgi:hypothetical protein